MVSIGWYMGFLEGLLVGLLVITNITVPCGCFCRLGILLVAVLRISEPNYFGIYVRPLLHIIGVQGFFFLKVWRTFFLKVLP